MFFRTNISYSYDGIYKVVKYFPQKGHSGYMIWRYLLKRDDPTPAPWTPEGKRMIDQLGLKMIVSAFRDSNYILYFIRKLF